MAGFISNFLKKISLGELFKKPQHSEVEPLLIQYKNFCMQCADTFHLAMDEYFESKGISSEFARLERLTHRYESEADDVRKNLEFLMYSKNLIPQSRGDILGLTEALDKVPNQMEQTVQYIFTHNIQIPPAYFERFDELVIVNVKAAKSTINLFSDFCTGQKTDVAEDVKFIDRLESQSDFVARSLVCDIFKADSGIPELSKLLLSRVVHLISKISNRGEQFGDRMNLVAVKRMF